MANPLAQIAKRVAGKAYTFATNKTNNHMKDNRILNVLSISVIGLTALGILMVSMQAFFSPQSVMDLVQVKLENNDAFSSIRGVYGGVGLTIFITMMYLAIKNPMQGLAFTALFCGLYAISRIMTIFMEGSLGGFGTQWLITETIMFLFAATLFLFQKRAVKA
jgi:hypothetical protein